MSESAGQAEGDEAGARELRVAGREAAATLREDAQDALARVAEERDRLLAQMREVNERLVLTALRAQELSDEAVAARAEAEAVARRLEETQWALRAADRRKDEFLAMLGHELRNPLAPILTAIELMKQRPDAASHHESAVIERQVRYMVKLVDDLLDVSRITGGRIELHRCSFELSAAVANALEMATPLLEARRHAVVASVPDAGLAVFADPTRIAQVIANLLTNGGKYTEPGGSIALDAAREGDRVRLSVKDSGVGIPAELLPRVFDMFVQAPQRSDRAQGGLGLGLAIVRSLVEAHGGEVVARSEGPGRGSEFVVYLPAAERASVELASPSRRPARPPRDAGTRRRILVVDDNVDAADMLADALRAGGHTVAVAYAAPEALTAVAGFAPEVVVMDIGLPIMDGYELAARLRDLEAGRADGRRLRLIAVTGYGQDADRERSAEAGMDAHLVKPVDLDQLEATVRGEGSISTRP